MRWEPAPTSSSRESPTARPSWSAIPNWWGKPEGNVDRAEFNIISNASTRVAALLSGEMDMIYSVPPQDCDRIGQTSGVG